MKSVRVKLQLDKPNFPKLQASSRDKSPLPKGENKWQWQLLFKSFSQSQPGKCSSFLEPLKTWNDQVFLEKNMKKIWQRGPNTTWFHIDSSVFCIFLYIYTTVTEGPHDDSLVGSTANKKNARKKTQGIPPCCCSTHLFGPRSLRWIGSPCRRGGSLRYVEIYPKKTYVNVRLPFFGGCKTGLFDRGWDC